MSQLCGTSPSPSPLTEGLLQTKPMSRISQQRKPATLCDSMINIRTQGIIWCTWPVSFHGKKDSPLLKALTTLLSDRAHSACDQWKSPSDTPPPHHLWASDTLYPHKQFSTYSGAWGHPPVLKFLTFDMFPLGRHRPASAIQQSLVPWSLFCF